MEKINQCSYCRKPLKKIQLPPGCVARWCSLSCIKKSREKNRAKKS